VSLGAVQEVLPLWRRLLTSRGVQMILAVMLFAWVFYGWIDTIGGPEEFRVRYGLVAAVVLVPVQAVVAVSPFPSEVLVFANSVLFGFWMGALMAWVGWIMAAFLQYGLVRRTAADFDFDAVRKRLPTWIRRFPVDHPAFLIGGRYLPMGSHIVNSAAGAFGVPLWRHGWCSAVSILPMAFLVSGIANGILRFA
jgi:uncharacterized membrane protein YdjX (TVP38/TMEM64 family)